jgi:phytoene dehydrogenase-like protein
MASVSERAIVLGADVEGLAAAVTLAQAGREVVVLDGQHTAGGVSRAVEFHPGHWAPGLWNESGLARRKLLDSLGLEQHGLAWRAEPTPVHLVRSDGEVICIERHALRGAAEDGAYRDWRAFVERLAPLISDVIDDLPPEAADPGVMDLLQLARKGFKLRTLGETDMMELLRIVTMPAWDWMEENFEDPALRAGLAAQALPGTVIGPRGAGTTALMLMREAARGPEPVGGAAALVRALIARCEELNVRVELGMAPTGILFDRSVAPRVAGVELGDGSRMESGLVLSALDPKTTLLDLVRPGLLPQHVEAEVDGWRMRGSSAVLLLALSKEPELPGGAERLCTASSPFVLERAADALKYGEQPAEPWLDVRDCGRGDPGCAPAGAGTLAVHVHGVPRDLRGGWTDAARDDLRERVLAALERAVPGVRDSLVGQKMLTPADLESELGLRGGQLFGGEEVLDQLWLQRPSLALSRYATPLVGLYLGGSGNHPGGAYLGGAGVLAARRALGR